MKEQLSEYLNRYQPFSTEEIDTIYSYMKVRTFQKKEHLLLEGEVCSHYYFILSGLVRSYLIDDKAQEKIVRFGIENWWITEHTSFYETSPSRYYIQALEPTQVLTLSKRHLEQLFDSVPKLERVFRIILEKLLTALIKKHEIYEKMSSREHYEEFLRNLPEFSTRIPQYMLASYLDITPEYLSSLRKSIKS